MFSTFNMGIGMMMFADSESADSIVAELRNAGEKAWIIGSAVKAGKESVIIER